jgi:two-component system sensor histidine kinase DesK
MSWIDDDVHHQPVADIGIYSATGCDQDTEGAAPAGGGAMSVAAALLSAAGIALHVDIVDEPLPAEAQELFGWAVREGVTNILRHSDARTATITIHATRTGHRLEITNDGAGSSSAVGSGLAGLTERARTIGGTLAIHHDGERFRLVLDIPGPMT